MAAPSKRRTAAELQNPDLNYYIAFKIDPKETDKTKIEEALKKKRNTFAKDQSVINSRLVELKDDIDQIMLNDAIFVDDPNVGGSYQPNRGGRKQEAENAKRIFMEYAVNVAEATCGRGYIWDYEIAQIAEKNNVDSKELETQISHLFGQGVTYKKSSNSKREIPFDKFKKIEEQLRTVIKKNLYDFLELPQSSSLADIKNRKTELYSTAQKQGKNATATAVMNLCGLIDTVFKSDSSKKEYDTYYLCKEQIWDKLSMFKNSGIKNINEKLLTEFMDIMHQCTRLPMGEVERELDAYLQFFGIVREASSDGSKIQFAVCPYDDCAKSYVVKPGLKVCPNCGRSLEIRCWNCGEVMIYTGKTQLCSKCGITKQDQTAFDNACKFFSSLSIDPNRSEMDLVNALNKMENISPSYDKIPDSFVAKKIADARKAIERKKKEKEARDAIYNKYVKELNALIAKKSFYKADILLKQLKNEDPTYDTKTFETTISTGIRTAQQYVDLANRNLQLRNESAAIENCGKALEACCDCSAATQILKSYPPKAPKNISARIIRNTVKIEWQTDGDQNAVTYTVIRKVGSAPSNDEDGDVVETDLTITFCEDSSLVSATAYYYAVFAERGGVRSQISKLIAPAVLFLDITNLHQEKVSDVISATWNAPDNVASVEVYRKAGVIPPNDINDGEKITVDKLTGFTDKKVPDDKYSYLFICRYSYLGKDCYSNGVKASYKKYRMPSKATGGRVESTGAISDFTFVCDEPQNGTIKLYYSPKKIDYSYGEVDDKANFGRKCKDLKEINAVVISNNKFSFSMPDNCIMWLYPVVSNEQLYVLSEPFLLNTIAGIDSVNVLNKNGNVLIEGSINSNVRNIVAIINETNYVDSIDGAGEKRYCTYDTFVKDKGFYISLKPGLYYVTLFAEFIEAGNKIYSRPTKLYEVIDNREKAIVQYAMNYNISVSGSYKVKVDFRADSEIEIPPVDLVIGYPRPLNKNAGMVIATIQGGQLKKKMFKEGYYYSCDLKVGPANSMKDRIVLFFNAEEKHILLKEISKV